MKQSLRNLLLVGAALVSTAALAQEAPFTVTQKWFKEISSEGKNIRAAAAVNGHVYTYNKSTGEIKEVDGENNKVIATVTGCNGIAADDAGNFLLDATAFPGVSDFKAWKLLPAGATEAIDITVTAPEGFAGRSDHLGRATGNFMSEPGGVLFATGNTQKGALPIVIINGEIADEFSEYAPDKVDGIAAANGMSVANPITNNVEDLLALDPLNQLGYYYRSDANYNIFQYDEETEKWVSACTRPTTRAQHGWDVFELGGEVYQLVAGEATGNWTANWCIAKMDGTIVYSFKYTNGEDKLANGDAGMLQARVINDKTVEIYQYYGSGSDYAHAGMWEVALPADPDPAPLYATGGFAGWDPKSPSVFDFKDGAYTLDVDASDLTDYKFKISTVMATDADADAWVAFNSGAIGVTDYGTDYTLQLDQQVTLEKGKEGNFQFPGKGTYTITVSADLSTLILSGIQAEPDQFDHPEKLYLRGASTNWGIDENYVMNLTTERGMNGEYVYETGNIALDGEFKVCVDADWNKGNWGRQDYQGNDGCLAATIGGKYGAWENCDNFKTAAAIEKCAVKFYYGGAGRQCYLQINATSGAEIIEAVDNSEATYYNLQGVKVAADNLHNGIYIRVANGKASKVLVK